MQKVKKIITAIIGTILALYLNRLLAPEPMIGGSGYGDYFPFPTRYFSGSAGGLPRPETLWLGVFADIVFWAILFFVVYKFSFQKK